jgi:HEPN domain-containing protein
MAMSPQDKFDFWLDAAEYDLRIAGTMLNNGHWLYLAFMCQQSVEKLVKGLYTLYIDDNVPRTHDIGKLIKNFETELPIGIPSETRRLFDKLSGYYLNNRYPDFKKQLSSLMDETEARALHSQTKEAFAWLLTLKP